MSSLRAVAICAAGVLTLPINAFAKTPSACAAPITGAYTNEDYGFSFVVPTGLTGRWQSPCTVDETGACVCLGNHGPAFDLDSSSVLAVFADYAADLDDPTLGDVLRGALDRIAGEEGGPAVHITAVESFRLRGRGGYRIRATAEATDERNAIPGYERVEYIFYARGVRCVIYLRSPRVTFTNYSRYLDSLLKSWKWTSN